MGSLPTLLRSPEHSFTRVHFQILPFCQVLPALKITLPSLTLCPQMSAVISSQIPLNTLQPSHSEALASHFSLTFLLTRCFELMNHFLWVNLQNPLGMIPEEDCRGQKPVQYPKAVKSLLRLTSSLSLHTRQTSSEPQIKCKCMYVYFQMCYCPILSIAQKARVNSMA